MRQLELRPDRHLLEHFGLIPNEFLVALSLNRHLFLDLRIHLEVRQVLNSRVKFMIELTHWYIIGRPKYREVLRLIAELGSNFDDSINL